MSGASLLIKKKCCCEEGQYKLTPCVAPIYELTPCAPRCFDWCDEGDIVGFHIDVSGVTDFPVCEDCASTICTYSGGCGLAASFNGDWDLYFTYEPSGACQVWDFAHQVQSDLGGIHWHIYSGPSGITLQGAYYSYSSGGSLRVCFYFQAFMECPIDWDTPWANNLTCNNALPQAGSGGEALVTPIRRASRCPGGGSIYTQDESICYSGTTSIYTNDDLSLDVGKCVVLSSGICYSVTEESGGEVQSVTVSSRYDECPPDKYAAYLGMVVTIEVGEVPTCFYVSSGGGESDGVVEILDSFGSCDECCGGPE
jgi:hypothetical protein